MGERSRHRPPKYATDRQVIIVAVDERYEFVASMNRHGQSIFILVVSALYVQIS